MRPYLKHSAVVIIISGFLVSCSGAKPATAIFWKKNPYKLEEKDKKDEVDFHLNETEEVIAENERDRDRREKEELARSKKEKDQEIEMAKKAEKDKKYKKVNDGTFNFY